MIVEVTSNYAIKSKHIMLLAYNIIFSGINTKGTSIKYAKNVLFGSPTPQKRTYFMDVPK